jgi:Ca2+-dependent lipid-binding protein
VDEVTLSGRLRLTGRLLLPRPPFLSRLEVAFLSPPQLDFRLGGLAAAADLPGSTLPRFLLVG